MITDFQILTTRKQYLSATLNYPAQKSVDDEDKTLVIMAHDFPGDKTGHENLYMYLESLMVKNGLHSLRFDFRGCGQSHGQQHQFSLETAAEDVRSVILWARKKGYENFILVGSGLGASACILEAPLSVKALIFFWPVIDLKDFDQTIRKNGKFDKAYKFWEWRDARFGNALMNDLSIMSVYGEIRNVRMPMMIFHGGQDPYVSARNVQIAKKEIISKRLECTVFHDAVYGIPDESDRKTIYREIEQFLKKNA